MTAAEERKDPKAEQTSLYEVIASPKYKTLEQHAFGMTFTDEKTAKDYARKMNHAGYSAEVSPEFLTEATLETALKAAREHFEDRDIK